jgi:hypothetical protein
MLEHIKYQNTKQRQILDNLFIERKTNEDKFIHLESKIQEYNIDIERRLNDLDPQQKQEYEILYNENNNLLNELSRKRQEIEEIN